MDSRCGRRTCEKYTHMWPSISGFSHAQSLIQSGKHVGIIAGLALNPCFFSSRNPGDHMGIAPTNCLVSRFLLTPQHAEFLFNTNIQFLINWLASNFCICENAWDPHPKFACILTFFSLRSPGDRVRSTLIVARISRLLPGTITCRHAFISMDQWMDY